MAVDQTNLSTELVQHTDIVYFEVKVVIISTCTCETCYIELNYVNCKLIYSLHLSNMQLSLLVSLLINKIVRKMYARLFTRKHDP